MEIFNFLIFIIGFLVLCLLCVLSSKNTTSVSTVVNSSSKSTRFTPTYFEIYDKSTESECSRLIVIYPFRWYILSNQNRVYVLDSESGYDCPTNMTPGVRITKSNNLEVTCLSMNKDTAIKYFEDVEPVRVDYDLLGKEKFTVTDALNMLFEKYLTLSDENETVTSKMPGPLKYLRTNIERVKHRFTRSSGVGKVFLNQKLNIRNVLNNYYSKKPTPIRRKVSRNPYAVNDNIQVPQNIPKPVSTQEELSILDSLTLQIISPPPKINTQDPKRKIYFYVSSDEDDDPVIQTRC